MSILVHQLLNRLEQCDSQQVVYLTVEIGDTQYTINCDGTIGGNDTPLALIGVYTPIADAKIKV